LAAAALCALAGAAISGCGSSTATTAARAKPGHHGDPTWRAATGGHGRGRDSSGPAAVVPAYPRLLTAALGIADGHLVWAGGEHLTVQTLADALLGARVVRAVELDINPEWVAGYLYGHRGGKGALAPVPSHLAARRTRPVPGAVQPGLVHDRRPLSGVGLRQGSLRRLRSTRQQATRTRAAGVGKPACVCVTVAGRPRPFRSADKRCLSGYLQTTCGSRAVSIMGDCARMHGRSGRKPEEFLRSSRIWP
jgi:hypothetical protein